MKKTHFKVLILSSITLVTHSLFTGCGNDVASKNSKIESPSPQSKSKLKPHPEPRPASQPVKVDDLNEAIAAPATGTVTYRVSKISTKTTYSNPIINKNTDESSLELFANITDENVDTILPQTHSIEINNGGIPRKITGTILPFEISKAAGNHEISYNHTLQMSSSAFSNPDDVTPTLKKNTMTGVLDSVAPFNIDDLTNRTQKDHLNYSIELFKLDETTFKITVQETFQIVLRAKKSKRASAKNRVHSNAIVNIFTEATYTRI